MLKAITTMERKTNELVMGGLTSKEVTLRDPFPLDEYTKNKLNLLTTAVNHILNTSDIYDINNLVRPGVCGDYVILLKKQIEQRFLSMKLDISGVQQSLVYQNPERLFHNKEERKEACSKLTNTAVTIASIIVACLASIQVAGEKKILQRGGAMGKNIKDWLMRNSILLGNSQFITNEFKLNDTEPLTLTYRSVNSLRVEFLDVIKEGSLELLPFRLYDFAGFSWLIGVIYISFQKPMFIPLSTNQPIELRSALIQIYSSQPLEDINTIEYSRKIFANGANEILGGLKVFLASQGRGYVGAYPQIPGYSIPGQVPYALARDYIGAYPQIPGYPIPAQLPYAPRNPMDYGKQQAYLNPQIQYSIPQNNNKAHQTLKYFKDIYMKHSCPASVRANTLVVSVLDNSNVRTGICVDPYLKESLDRIYPYATLKFLDERLNPNNKESIFIGLRIDKINCSQPDLIVPYQIVQTAILEIHSEYTSHTQNIWKILGKLIQIVEDPDTKAEMVRLVPAATRENTDEYVRQVGLEALKQIKEHYVRIEDIFSTAAKNLTAPKAT